MADEHAEGTRRKHHSRLHQGVPMEDSQEWPGRAWVSVFCCRNLIRMLMVAHSTFSYGHGVLRNPDPRFMALQQFCDTRPALLQDPIVQLVKKVSKA